MMAIFATDIELNEHSSRVFKVCCDLQSSPNCKNIYSLRYDVYIRNIKRNNGKLVCRSCSSLKCTRNMMYDTSLFSVIDTEFKAYLLGLIASDGCVQKKSITIELHKNDKELLINICSYFNGLKVKNVSNRDHCKIVLCSIEMVDAVCKHLNIIPGKKSNTVCFPPISDEMYVHFVRGYFDGDGTITNPIVDSGSHLSCSIKSNSIKMLQSICEKFGGKISLNNLQFHSTNAIDFLGKLYDNCSISMNRKKSLYIKWKDWVPGLSGSGNYGAGLSFRWQKADNNAIAPSKVNSSDSGYDLHLIKLLNKDGNLEIYDTGIKVRPDFGWYFQLVGRSSIIKSGYMLANSVGIIDRGYIGTIKVALIKIRPDAQLTLPSRLVQIIPCPIINMSIINTDDLEKTDRGQGGFGSTGSTG
jgi:deoxyuridine 5'-triphosphate nucleotidohydrolase